jgi:hypothetical protein
MNPVCTSQETHNVIITETKRLILFGETVAVYCENHMEHTNTLCGQNAETLYIYIKELSPYLTGNTLGLRYKARQVNAVWGNNRYVL